MSDNPEVARGLKLKIERDNQSCEFNAQNVGCMDGVGPVSTTLPSEGGNMLGDDQDPLLFENFNGNIALDSATDGGNVTGLQGRNDQIKFVKDEETVWTDEVERIMITDGCYAGEGSRSLILAPEYICACQGSSFKLTSKRKRENRDGENSLDSIVASQWILLQEEEANIQEQKLKLNKKRIWWLRRWRKMELELELEQKRLDIKLLKLRNQCLAFEARQKKKKGNE